MHISIKPKTTIALSVVLFVLALPQRTQAVSPAPDGGYPGGNTAEGTNALLSRTTGTYNTAIGIFSLLSLTDGSFCTGVGAGALLTNTAAENTATGAAALFSNTTGSENTANGGFALFSNTEGGANTAIGNQALLNNTSGNDNTASGRQALLFNTTGGSNTAIGESCLFNNVDGGANTAIGLNALQNNTHGSNNTAIGLNALGGSSSGSHNVGLGDGAGVNVTSASNVICIGADGNNIDNACYIGQIFGATSSGGTAVFVNSNGRLGTATSSRRFKDDIKPMDKASEALFALKPVTFHYKREIDPAGTSQFGLIAEQVERVNPDLVVRDQKGKPYTVRYDQVNAMLLNEFLKAHRKIQEQEATISELKKETEALVAHSKEQDSKIQKVSDQIEVSKAGPEMVTNHPRMN
ncbi:MAG TPA: tail fiber domain-containing protein [Candidatus Udaeobacter sp.]